MSIPIGSHMSRPRTPVAGLAHRLSGLLLALFTGLASTGSVYAGLSEGAAAAAPRFVDLVDYPGNEANWDRFHQLEDHLAAAFFKLCSARACAPRYLLWPMQLRCSVQDAEGKVAACVWVIAGSDVQVRSVGPIKADVAIWRCPLPIADGVPVEEFHRHLEADEPLRVVLPGSSTPLQHALLDCLSRPGTSS